MKFGKIAFWLGYPLIRLVVNGSQRSRVVVRHEDTVLVMRPVVGTGGWDLPGGGLHKNELPKQGALRELYEETGIRVRDESLLYCQKRTMKTAGIAFEAHVFAVELAEKPELSLQRHEVAEVRWVTLEELRRLDLPTGVESVVVQAYSW